MLKFNPISNYAYGYNCINQSNDIVEILSVDMQKLTPKCLSLQNSYVKKVTKLSLIKHVYLILKR